MIQYIIYLFTNGENVEKYGYIYHSTNLNHKSR